MAKAEYPENFPGKKQLEAAGKTPDEVRGMTEEELKAVDGIGPATAAAIVSHDWEVDSEAQAKGNESDGAAEAAVKSVRDKTGHTNVIK